MPTADPSKPQDRRRAWRDFVWGDGAWMRLIAPNAKRIGPDMVTTSQPWPHQLKAWRDAGVKTVIDLRGEKDRKGALLEAEACKTLGLTLINAPLKSRDVPTAAQVRRARDLFETIDYPALMHCKSGADRAGLMAALYRHFHLGEPIEEAMQELGFRRRGHVRAGKAGVLGYTFRRYLAEGRPKGQSFLEWVEDPAYDPRAIKREFKASWWGTLLSDRLLRRE